MDERKSKQRGSESGQETEQSVEWTAQRKSQDKGESEEASAGIESDGRRKEIADETIRLAVCVVARLTPPLMMVDNK